jgi:hypothetical protein
MREIKKEKSQIENLKVKQVIQKNPKETKRLTKRKKEKKIIKK